MATEQAQVLVQQVAQHVQQEVHAQIDAVVTRCLAAVFDDPYEFKIIFDRKRGKTEAKMKFFRQGAEIDPTTAAGGGVVDVAAFALRLSCLMLARPRARKFLCLDEPFRFLSQEYRPRMRDLLLKLAQETGVQIILVTHDEAYQIGKVVEL